eukprot:CAMPEP_0183371554 /NCGR_PEP_ID=MMETSP0164_2-20130417/105747_1 /TAXON_ID=221442 /ORGANISM="Coccolithus pelagicus ssp braarudi, Strain PLY182g" /LENGTH=82 /DNA_ID=CAMNT_0025548119 /DNA_START=508 /DNA_END=754 /DNA_ORIENTATION=+
MCPSLPTGRKKSAPLAMRSSSSAASVPIARAASSLTCVEIRDARLAPPQCRLAERVGREGASPQQCRCLVVLPGAAGDELRA